MGVSHYPHKQKKSPIKGILHLPISKRTIKTKPTSTSCITLYLIVHL